MTPIYTFRVALHGESVQFLSGGGAHENSLLKAKSAILKAMIARRVIMTDGMQADKLALSLLIGCSRQQISVLVRKGGASVFTELVLAVCLIRTAVMRRFFRAKRQPYV